MKGKKKKKLRKKGRERQKYKKKNSTLNWIDKKLPCIKFNTRQLESIISANTI